VPSAVAAAASGGGGDGGVRQLAHGLLFVCLVSIVKSFPYATLQHVCHFKTSDRLRHA
jgi:hypothetical protein